MAEEESPDESGRATTPHDALFKLTFEQPTYAADLLRAMLPPDTLKDFEL